MTCRPTSRSLANWPSAISTRFHADMYKSIRAETERLAAVGSNPANWQALTLQVRTAPDDEFAGFLHGTFANGVLDAYPEASLWLVSLNPVFEHRRGTIRVLFGAQHLPGELDRRQSQAEFEGIKTARALRSDLHIQSFLDAFLLSLSPWSLGLAFERYNGALVLLFGRPQGGGGGRDAHMMQDLHRVALFVSADCGRVARCQTRLARC